MHLQHSNRRRVQPVRDVTIKLVVKTFENKSFIIGMSYELRGLHMLLTSYV